eukprot:SAG25_NODE_3740_length_983_cov_1.704751_1_plen_175_part_01
MQDETARVQRGLLHELKRHGLAQPLLDVDVQLGGGGGGVNASLPASLRIYEGEVLEQVVSDVTPTPAHTHAVTQQRPPGTPILIITITHSRARARSLCCHGQAAEFAVRHALGHEEAEAVHALLDEQLAHAGLLPPLLFRLPVSLPQGRVSQVGQPRCCCVVVCVFHLPPPPLPP